MILVFNIFIFGSDTHRENSMNFDTGVASKILSYHNNFSFFRINFKVAIKWSVGPGSQTFNWSRENNAGLDIVQISIPAITNNLKIKFSNVAIISNGVGYAIKIRHSKMAVIFYRIKHFKAISALHFFKNIVINCLSLLIFIFYLYFYVFNFLI